VIEKINMPHESLPETAWGLAVDYIVDDHLLIIEDWTKGYKNSFCTWFVYNLAFRRLMVLKSPQRDRFTTNIDFLTNAAMWKKVSDHPNIIQVHFVENINAVPYIALEYTPSASLDQLVKNDSLFVERRYIWNLALINKLILNISNAMAYSHSLSV
jgi:serine/threonine protein kinase